MIRVNGIGCVRWAIRMPQHGEWRAHLRIGSLDDPFIEGAAVTITDDADNEWRGVIRATTDLGAFQSLEIIGGLADGLDAITTERYYGASVNARDVLADHCADVGEQGDSTELQPLSRWRTYGRQLRAEVDALARWLTGSWRVLPSGVISLAPEVPTPGETLGALLRSSRDYRVYECPDLPPLVSAALDGWAVGTAVYHYDGSARPSATVWQAVGSLLEPRGFGAEGATVRSVDGQTVGVVTDRGLRMSGLPLWSVAGVSPVVEEGARVLVLDLGRDPRSTIALASTSTKVQSLTLADGQSETALSGLQDAGRVVRYGDTIVMPSGAAATPTPTVVQSQIAPGIPVQVSKVRA